jgi:hypothetical protein
MALTRTWPRRCRATPGILHSRSNPACSRRPTGSSSPDRVRSGCHPRSSSTGGTSSRNARRSDRPKRTHPEEGSRRRFGKAPSSREVPPRCCMPASGPSVCRLLRRTPSRRCRRLRLRRGSPSTGRPARRGNSCRTRNRCSFDTWLRRRRRLPRTVRRGAPIRTPHPVSCRQRATPPHRRQRPLRRQALWRRWRPRSRSRSRSSRLALRPETPMSRTRRPSSRARAARWPETQTARALASGPRRARSMPVENRRSGIAVRAGFAGAHAARVPRCAGGRPSCPGRSDEDR